MRHTIQPVSTTLRESERVHESEATIAQFRLLVVIFALIDFSGVLFGVARDTTAAAMLVGAACAYNLFTWIAYWRRWRMRYRRHLMLLMDLALISWWLQITGPDRSGVFALYYVVVFIAALWFKVFGAVTVASLCSGLWIILAWAGSGESLFLSTLIAPLPALFLLAVLGGFIAEIHDRERTKAQELQQRLAIYEREIDLSREIQQLLRPRTLPQQAAFAGSVGLEIGAADRPSRAVGGGDYYDAFPLSDGEFAICLADVAGKSIRAQSRLPQLKYALRAVARTNRDPAAVVRTLNEWLYAELQPDLFITVLFAIADTRTGLLRFCNAGHSAPIIYGLNGAQPQLLSGTGPALGLVDDAEYRTIEVAFPAEGGGFVIYTDGVVNATHRVTGEFGEDRLANFVLNRRAEPAQSLAESIVRCVDDFEESTRSDDVTVLVLKASGVPART